MGRHHLHGPKETRPDSIAERKTPLPDPNKPIPPRPRVIIVDRQITRLHLAIQLPNDAPPSTTQAHRPQRPSTHQLLQFPLHRMRTRRFRHCRDTSRRTDRAISKQLRIHRMPGHRQPTPSLGRIEQSPRPNRTTSMDTSAKRSHRGPGPITILPRHQYQHDP
jgi:hypothetical protein